MRSKATDHSLALGAVVACLRENSGLSQRQLEERAGVPRSTVSWVERGHAKYLAENLHRIATVLGGQPALVGHAVRVRRGPSDDLWTTGPRTTPVHEMCAGPPRG